MITSKLAPRIGPQPEVLATIDRIALRLIDRAKPVRFTSTFGEKELASIYRQRYETVVERGWARPEDLPSGLEQDEFDPLALHIAGWDGETLAASARLVFPTPGLSLPTEQAFGVQIEPHGQVADLSRQIVARGYSSSQHAIFSGLLSYCWLQAQMRGFYYVCGDFTPAMIRLYNRLGLLVNPVGEPRPYWGEERIPIVQDVLGAASVLAARYLER